VGDDVGRSDDGAGAQHDRRHHLVLAEFGGHRKDRDGGDVAVGPAPSRPQWRNILAAAVGRILHPVRAEAAIGSRTTRVAGMNQPIAPGFGCGGGIVPVPGRRLACVSGLYREFARHAVLHRRAVDIEHLAAKPGAALPMRRARSPAAVSMTNWSRGRAVSVTTRTVRA